MRRFADRRSVLRIGLVILAILAGCADPDIGTRFRAERGIWEANRELQRLGIRPELVSADQWRALAGGLERLAADSTPRGTSAAGKDVRGIQANALLGAARIYGSVGDSTRMIDLYSKMEQEFSDLPSVTGEVGLARGRLAEARGDWNTAIGAYREVLTRVEPNSRTVGVAGAIMDLPLRIARLQLVSTRDTTLAGRRALYADARAYYQRVAAGPDTATALDAKSHLAELSADLVEWDAAEAMLREVEAGIKAMTPPPQDPAGVRFAIAQIQGKRDPDADTSRETFRSLVTDYPKSPYAPQALLAIALDLARKGRSDEAIQLTEELRQNYGDNEDLASRALLFRGQILEREGRWTDAQAVFASLPAEHPVSEAALLSYVEIVKHYERVGDAEGARAALQKAESAYREFLSRYPTGSVSFSAQEKLARTLASEKRYALAVDEFARLGEALKGRPQGATFLVTAAQMAVVNLGDTTRAVELLEKTGTLYGDREVGRWAAGEAARLRGGSSR